MATWGKKILSCAHVGFPHSSYTSILRKLSEWTVAKLQVFRKVTAISVFWSVVMWCRHGCSGDSREWERYFTWTLFETTYQGGWNKQCHWGNIIMLDQLSRPFHLKNCLLYWEMAWLQILSIVQWLSVGILSKWTALTVAGWRFAASPQKQDQQLTQQQRERLGHVTLWGIRWRKAEWFLGAKRRLLVGTCWFAGLFRFSWVVTGRHSKARRTRQGATGDHTGKEYEDTRPVLRLNRIWYKDRWDAATSHSHRARMDDSWEDQAWRIQCDQTFQFAGGPITAAPWREMDGLGIHAVLRWWFWTHILPGKDEETQETWEHSDYWMKKYHPHTCYWHHSDTKASSATTGAGQCCHHKWAGGKLVETEMVTCASLKMNQSDFFRLVDYEVDSCFLEINESKTDCTSFGESTKLGEERYILRLFIWIFAQ